MMCLTPPSPFIIPYRVHMRHSIRVCKPQMRDSKPHPRTKRSRHEHTQTKAHVRLCQRIPAPTCGSLPSHTPSLPPLLRP